MASTAITDYTNRDYDSFVESLLDVAAVKLPEWTDRSENDFGRLILELFAYVGDVISYYLDRVANEAFLATAVERRSVIDLLSLIGYTLDTPSPASVVVAVTPKDAATPVHVDVGAHFMTQAAAGKPAVDFYFLPENGAPVSSPLGQSNGFENLGFRLPQTPLILSRDPSVYDGFIVEVQIGGVWE